MKEKNWRIWIIILVSCLVILVPVAAVIISSMIKSQKLDALYEAIEKGNLDKVRDLTKKGTNVNVIIIPKFGITPLHKSAMEGHKDITEVLLDRGARINAQDYDGKTPLHWASANAHKEVILLLIKKGAVINAKDKNGKTPLDHLLYWEQLGAGIDKEVVEILRKASAKQR